MAKKYYWLKLKNNFFDSKEMKKLRKIAGGDTYTIIYLKMQLLSLTNEGKLYYDGIEETFAEEIALQIDEDPENVKFTLMFLEKVGLLEMKSDEELSLIAVPDMIGKECDSAERVRKHRALQCNKQATSSNALETKCNTEIELEKEIDIELESRVCILEIPFQNGNFVVDEEFYNELTHTYPNMDINASLQHMKTYFLSNPDKQRYIKGAKGSVQWWVQRDNDMGKYRKSPKGYGAGQPKGKARPRFMKSGRV